jgi:arginyl-tRNA synthetase
MLISQLSRVLKESERYGKKKAKALRVVVEFTDPNPFKEFHVGHLYSNTVGESLARLLEFQGQKVRRVNYQGDVGMHVAKSLYGLLANLPAKRDLAPRDKSPFDNPSIKLRTSAQGRQISNLKLDDVKKSLEKLEKLSLPERVKILGEGYAAGSKAFEDDPKAAEEMKKLNTLIFIAAQEEHAGTGSEKSVVDYRKGVSIDEQELSVVRKLYLQGRTWSLDYFETIYKRLGTVFNAYYFESQVGEYGMTLVKKHLADGVFEHSDGAIVYRGEKKGLHTRVFVNSFGLPTYEAKELGLAPLKQKDWPHNLSLIVTGKEINEYFRVVIAALSDINPDLAGKTKHVGHGMVRGPDGNKLSSREGNVLTGDSLIDEAKKRIYDYLQQSDRNYNKKYQEEVAEKAAIAAIKYSLLRVALPGDIAFDIEKSITFEGDSGPYLQYTYARARSVIRKAQDAGITYYVLRMHTSSLYPEEREVARLILYFPDIVSEAAVNLAPNKLANYLFNLAQSFNLFYAKHPIIGSNKDEQSTSVFRLSLTQATAYVLRNGLSLLGINVLEKM